MEVEDTETAEVCLSNLTSLTDLSIFRRENLRVKFTPNLFVGCEPPPPEGGIPPRSSYNLQSLVTDDAARVLAAPICTLLSSSLTTLVFQSLPNLERFTEEQEEALQLLTSLQHLKIFSCRQLQCLPAGLHTLRNLKRLEILFCDAFRSLPKGGLPSSLQELCLEYCSAIQLLPKDVLPSSLQVLQICNCPAIRSLPKDFLPSSLQVLQIRSCPDIRSLPSLPSSLRELYVRYSDSEELKRQCRKLRGIIPIVIA